MIQSLNTFVRHLATDLCYVNEPVVTMREQPNHNSKVVSQTSFSEQVDINKEEGDWASITTSDGYSGWIESIKLVHLKQPYQTSLTTSRLFAHLYHVKDTEYGPIKTVPYGSKLKVLDTTDARWIKVALPDGHECYVQRGDVASEPKLTTLEELVPFSKKFLGLPYTWGGRSSFGYDCSGFMQMLYQQIGINLQRDARQQILDPRFKPIGIKDLQPGDLIFWGKSEKDIRHVGMSINEEQFIHTSPRENKPWLRISSLSDSEWSAHPDAYYPYRTARQLIEK